MGYFGPTQTDICWEQEPFPGGRRGILDNYICITYISTYYLRPLK